MPKVVHLEEVWPRLEALTRSLLENIRQTVTGEEWAACLSSILAYCGASGGQSSQSGARFRGGELYVNINAVISSYLSNLCKDAEPLQDEQLLFYYQKKWNDYKESSRLINNLFDYINRFWLKRQREEASSTKGYVEVYTPRELALRLWRLEFYDKIKFKLIGALLNQITRDRNKELINVSVVKDCILSLIGMAFVITNHENRNELVLTVYKDDFETALIENTDLFYTMESSRFLAANTCSDYMKKVETRLAEEEERVGHYLHMSSAAALIEHSEGALIVAHMDRIQSEFSEMLSQDKHDDLKRLYKLLTRVSGGMDPLKQIFREHVRDDGLAKLAAVAEEGGGEEAAGAVSAKEKDRQDFIPFVDVLLELHAKYHSLINAVFNGDKSFMNEMNNAFSHIMNAPNNRSPEFLSLYIDDKLRKGIKGVTEEEIDAIINRVLVLFKRLEEKDLFERYYKNHLSKRLLFGRSASEDQERNVIAKLKTECGTAFTHKLEGMFKDMQLSHDIMEKFRSRDMSKRLAIDLSVEILTLGFWPSMATTSVCKLPPEIASCCQAFEHFYLGAHSGRRMTWQTSLGQAEVKSTFGKNAYLISMSTTQMAILMLYNTNDTLSFSQLREATQLDEAMLKRDLLALAVAKYAILNQVPPGKKILATDSFAFNSKFKTKTFKFKIAQVVVKESDKDRSRTVQDQNADREFMIDAAVVRVMKARKTLDHNSLVAEVITQLQSRFSPQLPAIKRQIEKLIEREYLERDEKDRKKYNYLA